MGTKERRHREREQRRLTILRAAEVVLSRQGYASATLEEIASVAEVSKGTLYLYFDNKEAICAEVLKPRLASLVEAWSRSPVSGETGLEQVHRLLLRYAQTTLVQPERFRLVLALLAEASTHAQSSPTSNEYVQQALSALSTLTEAVDQGLADGTIRSDLPAAVLALHLVGSIFGTLLVQVHSELLPGELRRMAVGLDATERYIGVLCAGLATVPLAASGSDP